MLAALARNTIAIRGQLDRSRHALRSHDFTARANAPSCP